MMKKYYIYITGVLVLIAFVAMIAGYQYITRNNSVPILDGNKLFNDTTPLIINSMREPNQTLQVKDSTVAGITGQKTPSTLPGPSDFKMYEEYSTSQTSLYIDELIGQGNEVELGDTVAMLYKGWLTNGELFDMSRPNQDGLLEPFVFRLGTGQVIKGWDQTIVGMKKGGKRRLIIPSSAGYGPNGQGTIPPYAMLIFDVELIAHQKP
jgi:FKBP-type peptidyl-prolyl cis-trans isomerase